MHHSLLLVCTLVSLWSLGQPNADKSMVVAGLRLYADVRQPNVYYYPPVGMALAITPHNTPAFKLIMMRYTGRKLSQDQQKKVFKNLCQFSVLTQRPSVQTLAVIQNSLGNITLKTLPIYYNQVFLIYTPINQAEGGFISMSSTLPMSLADEQFFTLNVSNEDAQMLQKALQQKQALISVGYAFFSEGVSLHVTPILSDSTVSKRPSFQHLLKHLSDSLRQKPVKKLFVAHAGATEISPEGLSESLLQKIDINEQLPAEFAALEVRCYDFNNDLRPDLYAKKVEVEAIAVDDRPTTIHTTFYKNYPDDCAKILKFNYAIKLDNPLRFRITEISQSGQVLVKGWKIKTDWGLVDVTGQ